MAKLTLKKSATPDKSPINHISLYVDTTDSHLKKIDENGVVTDLENPVESITLADLSDVDSSGATANDILVFDGANWVATAQTAAATALDDLTDVTIVGATDGEALVFNSISGQWENRSLVDSLVEGVIDVTYSELLTKITDSTLTVGGCYRITDFAQAYNIFDGGTNTVIEEQIGATEPLIVYALSTNKLERVAYSPNYPNDIIYYEPTGVNVTADIGYSDGSGTLVADFKGVIEFRHDTKQNVSTWYDFRNIKFRRWAVDAVAFDDADYTTYVAGEVCKASDDKIYKCITETTGEGDPTVNTADWELWLDTTADALVSWTADKTLFNIGSINTNNLIINATADNDFYTFGDYYNRVKNVSIGMIDLEYAIGDWFYTTQLNNTVFKTIDNERFRHHTCFGNNIGSNCLNNTIGNTFNNNTTGNDFNNNIIGNSFTGNTIENSFHNNKIGNYFYDNTIENIFIFNTIGNNINTNTIGNDFNYNTIGNIFSTNTIGNDFGSNTIGNTFNNNTIGNDFYSNTIGNSFNYNTIGNIFSSNTIGSNFKSNTIGNNSKVSAGINCLGNSIGDYNTKVTLGDNCTGISIGEKNNTITLGASCTNLTFQNGCTFNGNTDVTGLQKCLFESGTSITGFDFTSSTHIKATYNKRAFTNASSVVRLSYFDAADTLTVVNVND